MIHTYLLMDFCFQIVNFIWGQYVLNILRKRINVVSKTGHLINLYAQQRAKIVQVLEVALDYIFFSMKMFQCMEWHWSVAILWTNI